MKSKLEMQRLAGKFAFLFAGVYLIILLSAVVTTASGGPIPLGSFEQHGDYLPLATDTIVASLIGKELARQYRVLLLPPITISCSHEHAGWRGTVSISARTLHRIVTDVADSLSASGVHRLVIISGHGGNYVLSNVAQEASVRGPRIAVFLKATSGIKLVWTPAWKPTDMRTCTRASWRHRSFRPSAPRSSGRGTNRRTGRRIGRISSLWACRSNTKSGVIGRPSLGTAEKGIRAMASLVESFAGTYALLTEREA